MEAPVANHAKPENVRVRWFVMLLLVLAFAGMVISIAGPNLLRSRIAARTMQTEYFGRLEAARELKEPGGGSRRQVVKASLNLLVSQPATALEAVHELARRLRGHVEASEIGWNAAQQTAHVVIRVPVDAVEAARAELRKLSLRVLNESIEAKDVTGEYVDLEANIRNLQVEETQYRQIMARASTIKDTLAVAERLADVRGRIESAQSQFTLMSRQVEMASIQVALQAEVAPVVAGVEWKPWEQARQAWRDARQDLANYADFLLVLVIRFPAFVVWTATLFALSALAWKLLRWFWKRFLLPAAQGA
jgi:Domain of unknown function (DUF4349)